jgi:hypothetical protein
MRRYITLLAIIVCLSFVFGKPDSSLPVSDISPIIKSLKDMPPFKASIVLETENQMKKSRDTGTLYWTGKSCLIELSGEVILLRSDTLYSFLPGENPNSECMPRGERHFEGSLRYIKKNFDKPLKRLSVVGISRQRQNKGFYHVFEGDLQIDAYPSKVR